MKETLEALTKAFIAESQAASYLSSYADASKEEGYGNLAKKLIILSVKKQQISSKILPLIQNVRDQIDEEMEEDFAVEVGANLQFTDTKTNIENAIRAERYNHSILYPEAAKVAGEEGLTNIASNLWDFAKAAESFEQHLQQLRDEA